MPSAGSLSLSCSSIPYALCSLRHRIHFEVSLGRDSKGICHAIEKREHRRDVNRLGDLRLGPTMIAQRLHIFIGGAIRRFRHLGHILEQGALRRRQICLIEIALSDSLDCCFFCSLNPQEVCMRIQSIRTAVQIRYPACDGLLGFPGQMTFREMNRVAELHDFAQKIRPMAETLQNPRNELTA